MTRSGRPRSFDVAGTVRRAKDVFWLHGYAGTSMQLLKTELGVLPGSLHGTYGGKHALYLQALDAYIADQQRHDAELATSTEVLPALRRTLTAVLLAAGEAPGRGCFLGNTAAEVAPDDRDATRRLTSAFRAQEQVLDELLQAGQRTGEIRADIAPAAHAQLLLALMQGLHLLARTEEDPQRLMTAIDAAIGSLTPDRHAASPSTLP